MKKHLPQMKKHLPQKRKRGIMKDGPGDGVLFTFLPGAKSHAYLIPEDYKYCFAVYQITNLPTLLGETVAVFSHYIKRKEHGTRAKTS